MGSLGRSTVLGTNTVVRFFVNFLLSGVFDVVKGASDTEVMLRTIAVS